MNRVKHVIKLGQITSTSGTGSFSLPTYTKAALNGAKGAWIVLNATTLAGATAPSIVTDVYTLFSDTYVKTATATITGTGVTKINGDETVAPVAMGHDLRVDFTVTGTPSAVAVDAYLTIYNS